MQQMLFPTKFYPLLVFFISYLSHFHVFSCQCTLGLHDSLRHHLFLYSSVLLQGSFFFPFFPTRRSVRLSALLFPVIIFLLYRSSIWWDQMDCLSFPFSHLASLQGSLQRQNWKPKEKDPVGCLKN